MNSFCFQKSAFECYAFANVFFEMFPNILLQQTYLQNNAIHKNCTHFRFINELTPYSSS